MRIVLPEPLPQLPTVLHVAAGPYRRDAPDTCERSPEALGVKPFMEPVQPLPEHDVDGGVHRRDPAIDVPVRQHDARTRVRGQQLVDEQDRRHIADRGEFLEEFVELGRSVGSPFAVELRVDRFVPVPPAGRFHHRGGVQGFVAERVEGDFHRHGAGARHAEGEDLDRRGWSGGQGVDESWWR